MPYTLFSRGRPIGQTELGFPVVLDDARLGWFVPNAEGERLMGLLAAPIPAIAASMKRGRRDPLDDPARADATGDPSLGEDASFGAAYLADLAESAHHHAALELELRRADGTVVPTSYIGFQDTERLRQLAHLHEERVDAELPLDDELRMMMEADEGDPLESDDELPASWWEELDPEPAAWSLDDPGPMPGERYQVYVTLVDPGSLP